MRLRYLPANAAYVVTFGDSIVPVDEHALHETRADAVRRLASVGLGVRRSGEVYALEATP